MPRNIRILGHVPTKSHNALNASARAVLNISRSDMAATGWSPATRVFEVAGAGSCLITDAWKGIECFLQPEMEVLVAHSGEDVIAHIEHLDAATADRIGQAGRERVLRDHTYTQRAEQVENCFDALFVDSSIQLTEGVEDSITEISQR